jgi:hypothetical protein
MTEYVEKGGLRWGPTSIGLVVNASWPFATIRISPERVQLRVKFLKILDLTFDLKKGDLTATRATRGFFSKGVQFEHRKADYPPLLVFWSFAQEAILEELQSRGYNVVDKSRVMILTSNDRSSYSKTM